MLRRVGRTRQQYTTTYSQAVFAKHGQRDASFLLRVFSYFIKAVRGILTAIAGTISFVCAVAIGFFGLKARRRGAHSHSAKRNAFILKEDNAPAETLQKQESKMIHTEKILRNQTVNHISMLLALEERYAFRAGLIVTGVVVAFSAALAITPVKTMLNSNNVTLMDNGIPVFITSTAASVGQLMDEYGIRINDGDIVYPERASALADGDEIQISRAMSVETSADGIERTLRLQAGTVRDALAIAGVSYGTDDIIQPALETVLTPGITIDVTRVEYVTQVESERIHFREIVQEDKTLLKGKKEIAQQGKEGEKEIETLIVYHDGEEISRDVVNERIIEPPVHRIVKEGTLVPTPKPVATPKPTPKPTATPASTTSKATSANASKTAASSTQYTVTNQAVVHAGLRYAIETTSTFVLTAYTHTGKKTATGTWPKVGTVAVDPNVIPYGTYLYIPGYGIAVARDTGVSGNHIDLFFDTYEECIKFGRKRDQKVYILAKPTKYEGS